MKAKIEKYWPFTTSLTLVILLFYYRLNIQRFDEIMKSIVESSLTVSGTLIGFFLTIFTIISTIKTRRMQFIKEAGLYPRINQYLASVIIWHFINISIILFFPLIESIRLPFGVMLVCNLFLIFVVFFSWLLSIRFTAIFIKLLR